MSYKQVEVLRAACCVAGLDQQICDNEKRVLETLRQQIGVGQASFDAMLDRARDDEAYYQEQFKLAMIDAEYAIKTLLTLAIADHQITRTERIILQHFAQKLGMSQDRFEQLLATAEKYSEQDDTSAAAANE